jgi:erythronate-4-phosphate dehydrogenase
MNKSIKIVADDKIPFLKGFLEPFAKVEYCKGSDISKAILKDADGLITRTRTKCNKELLEGTKVKFIATATIGYDHIDTNWCNSVGIKWTNAPGCNSGSVKQYIASVLIRLSKKHQFDLSEKTIGIVGHGNVGSKVANLCTALGMRVLVNDPPLKRKDANLDFVSIEEIKEKADIITFHVPLNKDGIDKTFYMADESFLKSIKPNCIIINSSRGEVVKNQALKEALINHKLKGAVLDVWENEPNIDLELLQLVDFATPHIAGYSADGKANGTAMSVKAISDYFGFGINNWFPDNVPLPENTGLTLDCKGKSYEEIISSLILSTYDVQEDDGRLRKSVDTFEKQRGNYPLRREFQNYTPTLDNCNTDLLKIIKEIGFNI